MPQHSTPRECVERGASFLDHVAPGWAQRVDIRRLRVNSMQGWCPLGQIYGSFASGLSVFQDYLRQDHDGYLSVACAERYGFLPSIEFWYSVRLNREWRRAARTRIREEGEK